MPKPLQSVAAATKSLDAKDSIFASPATSLSSESLESELASVPTPKELSPLLPALKMSHAMDMPGPCASDAKILARSKPAHSLAEITENIKALQARRTHKRDALDRTAEGRADSTVWLVGWRMLTLGRLFAHGQDEIVMG